MTTSAFGFSNFFNGKPYIRLTEKRVVFLQQWYRIFGDRKKDKGRSFRWI
jgi:hypothetical protein